MGKQIEPKLQKIGEYLELGRKKESFFSIPSYQRPYSWGIEQCDKLWNDIIEYDENNDDNYFFGTVIVSTEDDDKRNDLIDGQQRTTTFLILLKALLIKINETLKNPEVTEETEGIYRGLRNRRRDIIRILYKQNNDDIKTDYDPNYDNRIYSDISIKILENNSINEKYKDELKNIITAEGYDDAEKKSFKIPKKKSDNKYTRLFKNFKHFYVDKISKMEKDDISTFARKLLEECEVIVIKSWNLEQAINMFNSLNSDGLPLSDADIISSKMYAEAKTNNRESEFKDLWEQLSSSVNELDFIKDEELSPILTQHMYYIRSVGGETKTNGSIDVTVPGLRRYFLNDNTSMIKNPISTTQQLCSLVSIWKEIQKYPIVKILLMTNENAKLFLASFIYRYINSSDSDASSKIVEADVVAVSKCLLRLFIILELVDIGYSSKQFKSFLFDVQNDLVNPQVNIGVIEDKFNKHILSNWQREDIFSALDEYRRNLLVYVDEYIVSEDRNQPMDFTNSYDIEHIMPSSGKNRTSIMDDAKISDKEEFNNYVNKIGNKIVLEYYINRSIGNEWFREKIHNKKSDKKGYIDSICLNAQDLLNEYGSIQNPLWTKDDIDKHTRIKAERIVKFIFG